MSAEVSVTPRQQFLAALDRKPIAGRVPHFELVFSPTMEAFGRVHPLHRNYTQWGQMSQTERNLHLDDLADLYIAIAQQYEHSAISLIQVSPDEAELTEVARRIRERTGDRYALMFHGDASFEIPDGNSMLAFSYRLADEPDKVHQEAQQRVDFFARRGEALARTGLFDGVFMCSDYCFNTGPFLSPNQFGEFIAPYLGKNIKAYRDQGFYVVKHTDGNIMPILDQLVQTNPHAIHSLDPQGEVDIAEVKRLVGDKLCLCGNVNCGLMDTGTDEQVIESCRYALQQGMPGYGFVFCSSNCIYTGLALERYELMLRIWREEGNYPATT